MFAEFVQAYGGTIIMAILTAIAGVITTLIKTAYDKHCKSDEAKKIVSTCVKAVEQIYKDLSGEERFEKAIENITYLLEQKNIILSEVEIKLMIESAVLDLKNTVKGDNDNGKN